MVDEKSLLVLTILLLHVVLQKTQLTHFGGYTVAKMTDEKRLEDLEKRIWKICSLDKKTIEVVEKLLKEQGWLVQTTPFRNSFYRERAQDSYNVPFSVALYLAKNRKKERYEFEAFSKISEFQHWALWAEVYDTASSVLKLRHEERSLAWHKRANQLK